MAKQFRGNQIQLDLSEKLAAQEKQMIEAALSLDWKLSGFNMMTEASQVLSIEKW